MLERPDSDRSRLNVQTSRGIVVETLRSLPAVGNEMTLLQLRTLVLLSARGAQSVPTLAAVLGVAETSIARECTVLVARGLVIRVPSASGRKEVVVMLSIAGRGFVDNLFHHQRLEFERLIERVPTEQRALVVDALDMFAESADPQGWPEPKGYL